MENRNKFNEEDRMLLSEAWKCWWCEKNQADCLHHIVGRGEKESRVESSILNAAPLCNNYCHLPNHSLLKTETQIKRMLTRTYNFLMENGYQLKEKDAEFISKYCKYYY